MVLSGVPRKKSPVTPPGIDPGTVRIVAQRLNHYVGNILMKLEFSRQMFGYSSYTKFNENPSSGS